jgi:hypothetical protein
MGVVQAIKLMRSTVAGDVPALPMAQIAVNLTDKKIFIGKDGTEANVIHFVDVGGVASMISTATDAYLPKEGGTISGNLTVGGNLIVDGDTITANVETMTVEDPIITLGGTTAPTVNDGLDRGVEFRWHNGTVAKVGFFGFDRSSQKFTFIPDATNTNEVFTGAVGTILANFEGALTGNASTATKVKKAVTFNDSGEGAYSSSGITFDGSTARTISYNTIGAAALAGSINQNFSTKDLSVSGTLGVTGNTTLPGGLFDSSTSAITFSYGVGITSGALTLSGKEGMETPYIDFRQGVSGTALSRIISLKSGELSIFGKQVNGAEQSGGKIKLKSDTYAEKALYIGGASGAKLVYVAASGDTPAYLKLQNYDGGVMHFVTTGGQTMYSAGVPAGGGGGSATVILNGETNDNPTFWAPTDPGTTTGQYLKWNNTTGIPEWGTLPTVTKVQIEDVLTGTIDSHDHTFASLKAKPNTLAGYGIGDAVHSSHLTGGGAHGTATTGANGFMSSGDKTNLNLLYANRLIYDAGDKTDLAAALTSIPSTFYKEGLLLKYADANEQHIYMYISTEAMSGTTKIKQGNWLRISKPDVDGGTY